MVVTLSRGWKTVGQRAKSISRPDRCLELVFVSATRITADGRSGSIFHRRHPAVRGVTGL